MKKILLSTVVIIAFVFYGIFHNTSSTTGTTTTNATSTSTTGSSATGASASTYKDGTYTGSAADALYGNIQVQATISGGKITNVTFLQAPNDRSRSVEINSQADPLLAQEAIAAQSANVNIVSGATDSSQAFIQSLTAALAQAKS